MLITRLKTMCDLHWHRVPYELRHEVIRTWVNPFAPDGPRHPTPEHEAAVQAAIDAAVLAETT